MEGTQTEDGRFVRTTAWARSMATPLRAFLAAETGGAAVLLGATLAALIWANVDHASYESIWTTELSIRLGHSGVADDLRHWVNDGLMAFFFFVVGLEARREFDMGELRERQRVVLPLLAGLGGLVVTIAIFLAFNANDASADGWGVAMSTDTAFALGVLALVGPRFSNRLRAFMVTVVVVDDLVALLVIATVYTHRLNGTPLLVALVLFGLVALVRRFAVPGRALVFAVLGVATWVAVRESGVDPVIVGLLMGLLTYAYPADRGDLERASDLFRLFREQPTPELARSAQGGVKSAISPNERLQQRFHPWSSYVIVPLFALANAGIALNGSFLADAFSSPITLGIVVGYVVGKPVGVTAAAAIGSRVSGLRLPVGWGALAGAGASAGVGFTVSLLIASRAFQGEPLQQAKLGVLCAALCAALVSLGVFRSIDSLDPKRRMRLLMGRAEDIVDLAVGVDADRDHIRGPHDAPVTLVEYGDFECPYCGQAEDVIRDLLGDFGDLRYVWRHLPLTDVHPHAQLAAEAAEAAGEQDAFWDMHDALFADQEHLRAADLVGQADQLGLDIDRFAQTLREHAMTTRVAEDVDGADLSGVSGTPTFFINGRRHHGAYDIDSLRAAVHAAGARALVKADAGRVSPRGDSQ